MENIHAKRALYYYLLTQGNPTKSNSKSNRIIWLPPWRRPLVMRDILNLTLIPLISQIFRISVSFDYRLLPL